MKKQVVPIQLATRIADVTDKQHHRHAIFTITTDKLDPQRVFNAFREDIKRMDESAAYKLAWFRCGNFITVLVSGTPTVTSYTFAFVAKGKQRKLFDGGAVIYEGISTHKFKIEADKLLQEYTAPSVKHSFGGTN